MANVTLRTYTFLDALQPQFATFMGKTQVDEEGMTRYRGTVPLGRLNKPEDLAAAALFLASDDAAMITGSVFPVDGGRCI